MEDLKNHIAELEAEIGKLKAELAGVREQGLGFEESRKSLLYMLEDLNKSSANVEKAKKEWEATFDAISDPLFIHDKNMKVVRANKAYIKAAGLTFNEIIGKPYYEVFPKMEGPLKMCQKALELQQEEEVLLPSTDKIFKVIFYPIKDVEGKYLYSIHIMEDITEAKRTAERYKIIIQTAMDGFWMADTHGRILDVNDAYCQMTGYSRDELLTMSIPDVEVVETPEETAQHIQRIIEKGWDSFESHHRRKDGRVVDVEVSVNYMKIDAGRFVVFIRDITERKKAEERIKEEMEITSHLLMIAEATAHTTDIDKLMGQVVHCGQEIMKCDVCLSYVWDEEAKAFRPSQQYGLPHEFISLFMTEHLDEKAEFAKKAMEGEETVVIQFGGGGNYFSWLSGVKTIEVIPLTGNAGRLGIIIGAYKASREFTEKDKKLMQGISHQVSTALEQARLYKEIVNQSMELSHKVETIQVMHEIDRSILSTLESQEILETVTRMIARVIPCDRATVALVDKERKGFIYAAGFGIITAVPKGAFVQFADTNTTEVVETGRTQYMADMRGVKRHLPLEERLFKEGFLSHIRVPLIIKNEVIGALTVASKRPSAFTKEDFSTLEKVASQIGVALENARLISDLEDLFLGTVKSLSSAIDAKSKWTAGHSERVTGYAVKIAKEMGMNGKILKDIELSGLLHDIGKIGTYESILDKPGRLTDEELAIMRQHPVKGAEILASIKQLKDIIPGVKYHHEFYDGKGYPDGLKGEAIPLLARILCVADTVDAMGADRPYRKGRTMDVIIVELKRCSGTQFDPKVVETFLKVAAANPEFFNKKSL